MAVHPRKRRRIVTTGAILFVALAAVAAGYQFGVLQTVGYEWKTKRGGGFVSSNTGLSLGVKWLHLSPGTTFFADYDADVRAGSLSISLMKMSGKFGEGPRFAHRVETSGEGHVRFFIEEPGWYKARFEGSPLGAGPRGAGYDVDYSLRWGIR